MKAVVQRVSSAAVVVEGETVGRIGTGMVVLLGVEKSDDDAQARALATRIAKLRIFPSERRPIDADITAVGGAALVVSQFTLCADTSRGNRPSFIGAAPPEQAEALYERFCAHLRAAGVPVATGRFAAHMDLTLTNSGPVTIVF